jgi:hypothetical protein
MNEPKMLSPGDQRTRRNIMKMGAIVTSAIVANLTMTKTAAAGNGDGNNGNGKGNGGPHHCLLKGTRIRTAHGDRKIEDLAIGDLVPTMFGGLRPIQWIARYPYRKGDPSKPWAKSALPVRIARSALGPNVPHDDLYLTSWHSVLIDGVLTPAGSLINATTIKLDEAGEYDELEYFHVKLESHDVIYAEGAPVETLLRVDERAVNFAEYFRICGAPKTAETRCAPLVCCDGGRGELMSRFRSAISPWFDRREQIDVIRDRLEERGIISSRQPERSR